MSEAPQPVTTDGPSGGRESGGRPGAAASADGGRRRWLRDQADVATVAACVIIAAGSWFLLKEFAPVLRPLLLAVFLCSVAYPTHHRLTQRIPAVASVAVLAGVSIGVLVLLAWLVLGSVAQLSDEMPRYLDRAQQIRHQVQDALARHLPPWLTANADGSAWTEAQMGTQVKLVAAAVASAGMDVLREAILVAIFLVFLLIEAATFPQRLQQAFHDGRPAQILAVVRNINDAMTSYLRVKTHSSLILAVPVAVVLWLFGVKFALLWGVLTFLLNFIPYLGSIAACTAPIILAALQMESLARPSILAVLLVAIHLSSAYLIEPALTGRAVGLSPIVILMALSFWGLCWGLIGVLLAVPLTVMVKIILDHVPFTQPLARLMGDD
ncbi:MAG: AI-2E family transporter [Gemmataceae bacterium]|nr:AI-2E family transporter [Gemmataceae bacterium]MDW8266035.1 AI-2E family transporter [Gemmataceae bacterium]